MQKHNWSDESITITDHRCDDWYQADICKDCGKDRFDVDDDVGECKPPTFDEVITKLEIRTQELRQVRKKGEAWLADNKFVQLRNRLL